MSPGSVELSSSFLSSGFLHIHFMVETTSIAQPVLVFLLGDLMTSSSVRKPPELWCSISEDNSPSRVWWQSTQSWAGRVDTKSPASTAGPDFRLGLIFEEISHSRAVKMRLCVAESLSLLSEFGLGR